MTTFSCKANYCFIRKCSTFLLRNVSEEKMWQGCFWEVGENTEGNFMMFVFWKLKWNDPDWTRHLVWGQETRRTEGNGFSIFYGFEWSADFESLGGWFWGRCGDVVDHVLHLRHVVHHVLHQHQRNGVELRALALVAKNFLVAAET